MPNIREIELWRLVDKAFQNSIEKFGDIFAKDVTRDLLANGVTVQEWISVKDRLPIPDELDEKGFYKAYFVATNNGFIMHTALWDGKWWTLWGKRQVLEDVTHWMPLPPAPEDLK